ncbi:MAG: diguanylate cyclase [Nitrospirota bacterium]
MPASSRIMIVEDEGITALKIKNVLISMGHTVTSIEVSGRAAAEHALRDRPDLILMDVMLAGEMDGIEASRQIHSETNIPIVFITAYSDIKTLDQIKESDPFGYINKPFNDEEFRMAVDIALYKDEMERQLKQQNDLLVNIIDSLTHPFYVINVSDYAVMFANVAAKLSGASGAAPCYAFAHGLNEPCSEPDHPCIITKIMEAGESAVLEHIHNDREGNTRIVEVYGYPIFNDRGDIAHVIEYTVDITERKLMNKKLADAAITDDLTGLFNRRGFFTLAQQQCRLADRQNIRMALLYMDLDGFKSINDELGHNIGDEALIDTANILRNTFRKSDIVARIGGDEFAVLLTEPAETTAEETVVAHLINRFEAHNKQGGRQYELLLSIGMAHYDPERPSSIDQLLNRADERMYEDKRRHKLEEKVRPILRKMEDRRVYERFRTGDDCWVELDISGKVKLLDISLTGARISTFHPLSTDIIYKIKISSDDGEEITLAGVLVWISVQEPAQGREGALLYSGGLKFIEISDSQKIALDRFAGSFKFL